MKESYVEGLAAHDGPESCVGVRKGEGAKMLLFSSSCVRETVASGTGGERTDAQEERQSQLFDLVEKLEFFYYISRLYLQKSFHLTGLISTGTSVGSLPLG